MNDLIESEQTPFHTGGTEFFYQMLQAGRTARYKKVKISLTPTPSATQEQ